MFYIVYISLLLHFHLKYLEQFSRHIQGRIQDFKLGGGGGGGGGT